MGWSAAVSTLDETTKAYVVPGISGIPCCGRAVSALGHTYWLRPVVIVHSKPTGTAAPSVSSSHWSACGSLSVEKLTGALKRIVTVGQVLKPCVFASTSPT